MTQQQRRFFEIDACLAKASSARETWPAAPETEKHVACSNEVLELERAIVKDALRNAQNEGFTGDGELSRLGVSCDRAKLMSALSIAYVNWSPRTMRSGRKRESPALSELFHADSRDV